jgi:CHASE3 domain sensor protein
MKFILSFILVALSCIVMMFISYCIVTNNVIKRQRKEISRLRTENMRLKTALKNNEIVQRIEITDHGVIKAPSFSKW